VRSLGRRSQGAAVLVARRGCDEGWTIPCSSDSEPQRAPVPLRVAAPALPAVAALAAAAALPRPPPFTPPRPPVQVWRITGFVKHYNAHTQTHALTLA